MCEGDLWEKAIPQSVLAEGTIRTQRVHTMDGHFAGKVPTEE